jgi:hypothetical protein
LSNGESTHDQIDGGGRRGVNKEPGEYTLSRVFLELDELEVGEEAIN